MDAEPPAPGSRPVILNVITHLAVGGAEVVVRGIVEGVTDARHIVFACRAYRDNAFGREMRRALQASGAAVVCGSAVELKAGGLLLSGLALRRTMWRTRPDVVHLHTEIPEATYALARAAGTPRHHLVRTSHNACLWTHWRAIGAFVEYKLASAVCTAVGDSAAAALAQRAGRRGRTGRSSVIRIIRNGVSCSAAARTREVVPATFRMLFAGRLEPQKGVDDLPAIAESCARALGTGIRLTIRGSGSRGGALEAWARDHGVPNLEVVLEPSTAGIVDALAAADVVVMPSRFEGLGMVALEAACAGVPVVAFDCPGLSEAFPPGYRGLVAGDARQFADRVLDVARDPHAWTDSVDRAHRWVSGGFGLETTVGAYASLYRELVNGHARMAGR